MARFHYLEVAKEHKRLLVVFDKHVDDIPKAADGTFCVPIVAPETKVDNATKGEGTGKVIFGLSKTIPPQKSARLQLHEWLDAGFRPNNICMIPNRNPKLARYFVQVWLDRETPDEDQKTFADFGELGNYALGLIDAIHSACRVYDNGDSISVNMAGVELERRINTYYHELKTAVVSSEKPALVAKAVPTTPPKSETVPREVKAVATPVPAPIKLSLTLVPPTHAPTAIELALMKAVKK